MNAPARIVHQVSGRTRLKIPARRGDVVYFDRVSDRLSDCPGVVAVESNFRTSSVLIQHTIPFKEIAAFAAQHVLFVLQTDRPAPDTLLQQAAASLQDVDGALADRRAGSLNVRSLMLIALLSLGLIQIARGQILAPASSLLLHALELLDRTQVRNAGKATG